MYLIQESHFIQMFSNTNHSQAEMG